MAVNCVNTMEIFQYSIEFLNSFVDLTGCWRHVCDVVLQGRLKCCGTLGICSEHCTNLGISLFDGLSQPLDLTGLLFQCSAMF